MPEPELRRDWSVPVLEPDLRAESTRSPRECKVDPFVFVAATRYAILRTLTSASELVARQVIAHADAIRAEPGAAGAIINEIEEARAALRQPQGFGQSQAECDAITALWGRAEAALR